jgi:hypothetical protein
VFLFSSPSAIKIAPFTSNLQRSTVQRTRKLCLDAVPKYYDRLLYARMQIALSYACLRWPKSDSGRSRIANKEAQLRNFPTPISQARENRIKWIMMGVVFNHLWPDVGAKSDYRRKPALAISCFFSTCALRTMRVLWVWVARSTTTTTRRQGRLSSCVGNQHIAYAALSDALAVLSPAGGSRNKEDWLRIEILGFANS